MLLHLASPVTTLAMWIKKNVLFLQDKILEVLSMFLSSLSRCQDEADHCVLGIVKNSGYGVCQTPAVLAQLWSR